MTSLAITAAILGVSTAALAAILLRTVRTRRAWFIGIDPALSDQPLLFWFCTAFTILPFIGGLFVTVLLAIALS